MSSKVGQTTLTGEKFVKQVCEGGTGKQALGRQALKGTAVVLPSLRANRKSFLSVTCLGHRQNLLRRIYKFKNFLYILEAETGDTTLVFHNSL